MMLGSVTRRLPRSRIIRLLRTGQQSNVFPRRVQFMTTFGAEDSEEKQRNTESKVSQLGLVADTALMLAKGGAGLTSGSSALTADALHSGADMLSSAVVYYCVGQAHEPPDKTYRYGHGKIESLGTLAVATALVATGVGMSVHSGLELWGLLAADSTSVDVAANVSLLAPDSASSSTSTSAALAASSSSSSVQSPWPMYAAVGVAGGSVAVKEALYRYTLAVGEANQNSLLVASAWHHRSDAYSSVVALIGCAGCGLGWPLLDPLAGLVVSGMIGQVGVELGVDACHELLDAERPEAERRLLKQAVNSVLNEASSWQDATGSSTPPLAFTTHRRDERATTTTTTTAATEAHMTNTARHKTAWCAADSNQVVSPLPVAPRLPGARMLRLRTRKMGPHLLVDVELEVPPRVSASGAHQVAEHVRRAVIQADKRVKEVAVHVDPRGAQRYRKRRRATVGAADIVGSRSSSASSSSAKEEDSSIESSGKSKTQKKSSYPEGIPQWSGLEKEEDLMPMPHAVEEEVRRVVMALNYQEEEGSNGGPSLADSLRSESLDSTKNGDSRRRSGLPSGVLRGVRAIVGVSELQCFYLFESIHVKLDLVLHPNLTLGEAHQVARLVRSALLAAPSLGWIEDVDVDLELDDRLHSDPQTEAPWRRADAVRRESSAKTT